MIAIENLFENRLFLVPLSSFDPGSTDQKMYAGFLETHVKPGLGDLFLSSVRTCDVLEFLTGETVLGFDLPTNACSALWENANVLKSFVHQTGAEKLMFTKEGAWYIPPKMRETWACYKEYLLSEYNEGHPAGLAAIVCARNEPIPAFVDGVQQGGFEIGDYHAFLSIIELSSGRSVELHQTFMGDSTKFAFRPGIVGVNLKMAEELYHGKNAKDSGEAAKYPDAISYANAKIKDLNTYLDNVGMLGHNLTGLVSYQCEMIGDPTHACNWDGETPGCNFNYIPALTVLFELTQLQLSVLKADRLMAIAECKKIPAVNSPTQDQNEKDFIPATVPAFFPDGTPRYVRTKIRNTSERVEVIFKNAIDGSNGAIQVQLFRMTVPDGDKRQVTMPYNHYGNVAGYGYPGAANCIGAIINIMKGIAAGGCIDKNPLHHFGNSVFRINGLARSILKKIRDIVPQEIHLQGRYCGKVKIYAINDDHGPIKIIDFCDVMAMAINAPSPFSLKKMTPLGFTGKNAKIAIGAREGAVKAGVRPKADELLLFPTGTVGDLLIRILHHSTETDA